MGTLETAPQVAIVTDSTADIPDDVVRRLGITVVPLSVTFAADRSYLDGVEITPDQFWGKLAASSALPTTSQPSVAQFDEVYRRLIDAGYAIVSIHLSGKLSGTVRSAELAAAELPDGTVTVVDSGTVAMALGWLAIAAAEKATEGASRRDVTAYVNGLKPRCGILMMLDTLENLRKGGRIGRASALIGTLLNIKPILQVRDGEVVPLERVRTKGKALQRLIELANEQAPYERLAVAHGHDPDGARQLTAAIQSLAPAGTAILETEIGPVLGTHAGPGVFGLCYIRAP